MTQHYPLQLKPKKYLKTNVCPKLDPLTSSQTAPPTIVFIWKKCNPLFQFSDTHTQLFILLLLSHSMYNHQQILLEFPSTYVQNLTISCHLYLYHTSPSCHDLCPGFFVISLNWHLCSCPYFIIFYSQHRSQRDIFKNLSPNFVCHLLKIFTRPP